MEIKLGCIKCSKHIEYLGETPYGTLLHDGFSCTDMKEDDRKFFCSMECLKTFDYESYNKVLRTIEVEEANEV
jgi:hypothetical protein